MTNKILLGVCCFFNLTNLHSQINVSDDFENSYIGAQWIVFGGQDITNKWCIDSCVYSISGKSAFVCNSNTGNTTSGYTSANGQSEILAKQFSAGSYTNLQLNFDWKCNGENGKDFGSLYYSLNTSDWIPLISVLRLGDPALVTNQSVALPKCLSGSTFYIGFTFTSDQSFNFQPGLVIDNLSISGNYCSSFPNAPTSPSNPTVCENHFNKISVSANPGSGGNSLRWYLDNTACGTRVNEGIQYQTLPNQNKTIYVSTYNSNTGCESIQLTPLTISIHEQPNINLISVTNTSLGGDGYIETTITGGSPPYSISWGGPNGFSSTSENIQNLEAGSYLITVSDSYSCDSIRSITIEEGSDLIIPKGISPNNDGKNDVWQIEGIYQWNDFEMSVFNAMNELVYEQRGKETNGFYTPWNGYSTLKNKILEDGEYFYSIHSKSKKKRYSGILIIKSL